MYCKKCGKKGKKGDIYCEECGTKLSKNKKSFKLSEKAVNRIVGTLVTVAIILSAYGITYYLLSPVHLAKKYFNTVTSNDISDIYEYIDEYEGTLVSEELLEEKISLFSDLAYYDVEQVEVSDTQAIVEFSYVVDGQESTVYVLLNKTGDYKIFNTYEVASAKLARNVSIVVPDNAEITLDGIDIEEYLTKSENGLNYYDIDAMITGSYEVEVTVDDTTTTEDYFFDSNKNYYVKNVELTDAQSTQILDETRNKVGIIYNSLIEGKSYSEIASNFDNSDLIQTNYRTLKQNISKIYSINSLSFGDMVVESVTYGFDNTLVVSYYVDYTINYSYDSYDTVKTKTANNTTYTTISYTYEDGMYILNEIEEYMALRG